MIHSRRGSFHHIIPMLPQPKQSMTHTPLHSLGCEASLLRMHHQIFFSPCVNKKNAHLKNSVEGGEFVVSCHPLVSCRLDFDCGTKWNFNIHTTTYGGIFDLVAPLLYGRQRP